MEFKLVPKIEIGKNLLLLLIVFAGISLVVIGQTNFSWDLSQKTVRQGLEEGCGYSVIGVSDVDYRSNVEELNFKDAILLTIIWSPENECAYGYVRAEDINKKLEEKGIENRTKYDFAVRLDNLEQSISYRITNKIPSHEERALWVGVHDITNTKMACSTWWAPPLPICYDDVISQCETSVFYHSSSIGCYDWWLKDCDAFCFFTSPVGWYGTFGDAKYSFPVEISMENDLGETLVSATLDGEKDVHAYMEGRYGEVRAYANWVGFLMGPISLPEIYRHRAVYNTADKEWHVVEIEEWDNYDDYDESGFEICVLNAEALPATEYLTSIDECMADYDWYSAKAVQSEHIIKWDWYKDYTQVTAGEEIEGEVKLIAHKPIRWPIIKLILDVEWVGIFSPAGEPEITDVRPDSLSFESTDERFLYVTVKNVGSGSGTFTVSSDCSTGFTDDASTDSYAPNEEKEIRLMVSGTCAEERSGTCTVKAVGKVKEDVWTPDIAVTCSPLPDCTTIGARKCSEDRSRILICREGKWDTDRECDFGCVDTPIGPKCKIANCTRHEECDDGNPCTLDRCVIINIWGDYGCENTWIPNCGWCGDGICDGQRGENWLSCPEDCQDCGNGVCQRDIGETYETCPADCKVTCGDGWCETGESVYNCPEDCGEEEPETCDTQLEDCTALCGINPICHVQCQFAYYQCIIMEAVTSALMWIGLIVVLIIIVFIVIKLAGRARRPPFPMIPPWMQFQRRGY